MTKDDHEMTLWREMYAATYNALLTDRARVLTAPRDAADGAVEEFREAFPYGTWLSKEPAND